MRIETVSGDAVATISLGDDWEMKFRPVKGTSNEDESIMLATRVGIDLDWRLSVSVATRNRQTQDRER